MNKLRSLIGIFGLLGALLLSACQGLPQVQAQDRLFLDLEARFLGAAEIPGKEYKDTQVGGLSAITYDRKRDRFFALSDDPSSKGPARFYTLKLSIDKAGPQLRKADIKGVTLLRTEVGEPFPRGTIDAEGIALSAQGSLFIATEGVARRGIQPIIGEFDLETGNLKQQLPIPARYWNPEAPGTDQGIVANKGFESLALSPGGLVASDPFRLFTAVEEPLAQDAGNAEEARVRWLHYSLDNVGPPQLVAEHVYLLEPAPENAIANGLTDIVTLPWEGVFITLERSFSLTEGTQAKLFQVVVGNATDTSRIASLAGDLGQVEPLKKKLLLDLATLPLQLDNLEGITLGPQLPDGSKSLVLISDDNFRETQVTQVILLGLTGLP
ncbi:MAG: esterase-like activity of phytase family protein [Cyanobacteria bacterium P01_H01_bin.15]